MTAAYAALIFAPAAFKLRPRPIHWLAANAAFLALYSGAAVYLGQASHQGGLLVHRYGIHATVGQAGEALDGAARRDADGRGDE